MSKNPRKFLKLLRIISLILLGTSSFASESFGRQTDFSLYQTDLFSVNPAAGGTNNYLSVKVLHRNSWQGFPGAPKSYRFSAHSALLSRRGSRTYVPARHHTLGISALAESSGSFVRTTTSFSYGYHLSLKKNLRTDLRLGLAASVSLASLGLDIDEVRTLQAGDPAVPENGEIAWVPDTNLGLWLYSEQFYAGLSVHNFSGNAALAGRERNLLAQFGFMYIFPDDKTAFIPSVLVQYSESAIKLNAGGKFLFSDKAWFGINWRWQTGAAAFFGFNVRQIMDLSYAVDINFTEIRKFSGNSHEVALALKIGNYNHRRRKRPRPVLFD